MSIKSVSSGAINRSVAQQTHSSSTAKLFKLNQLTCSILAASTLLLSAPLMAAPTPITDQTGAGTAGTAETITVNMGETQEVKGATDYTLNKKVTGPGGLTKKDMNTVTLGVANDYTGDTIVENGTLAAGAANVFSAGSDLNITNAAGTVDLKNFNQTIKGLSGVANSKVMLGTGTLTTNFTTADGEKTFNGVISGGAGSGLIKLGDGTLVLNGTNTNEGSTTITAGTLKTGTDGVLSSSSNISIGAAGTLDITSRSQNIRVLQGAEGSKITLGANTLTTSFGGETPSTFAGIISGTGSLVKSGTGTLILTGENDYTGKTTINNGTLQLTKASKGDIEIKMMTANLAIANTEDQTQSNITGAGNLIKLGTGNLTLSGTNGYTGNTTISEGTLKFAAAAAPTSSKSITLEGRTIGESTTGGTLELVSGGDITLKNLSGMAGSTINLGTTNLTASYDAATPSLIIAGTITGTGNFTKDGTGTLVFSGTNPTMNGSR